MTQVLIIGGSSLLGHHLITLLAKDSIQTIAFLPEDEALYFAEKYPEAKLAFLPFEPKGPDQVNAFMKAHPDITHIVILKPHPVPTQKEFDESSKNLELDGYHPDEVWAFSTAETRVTSWLEHVSGKIILLESSLKACDADDSVMDQQWKVFTHRDICMVTYANAVKSMDTAARYTDAMVEHAFWSQQRWCYPPGIKVALPTAPLTGPGIQDIKYKELDFQNRENLPLFIDVRDAALVYRQAIFSSESKRQLLAQGTWDEEIFQKLSQDNGLSYPRREAPLLAGCDTYALQSSTGVGFRNLADSLKDTFEWISQHKSIYS